MQVVRTHRKWHENAYRESAPAHVLNHFTTAHGSGTVFAASMFDSSPTRPLQWAYGDNYLHSSFAHYLDLGWCTKLSALSEILESNRTGDVCFVMAQKLLDWSLNSSKFGQSINKYNVLI